MFRKIRIDCPNIEKSDPVFAKVSIKNYPEAAIDSILNPEEIQRYHRDLEEP